MTRPPAFANGFKGTITLGAYAKPSTHRYCTRPLSNLKITVVKQMERVDLFDNTRQNPTEKITTPDPSTIFSEEEDPSIGSFAGCGMITVKRNVHGYKKISLVTRDELSRSELSLPDMVCVYVTNPQYLLTIGCCTDIRLPNLLRFYVIFKSLSFPSNFIRNTTPLPFGSIVMPRVWAS